MKTSMAKQSKPPVRVRKSVSIIHLEIYLIASVLAHKAGTHEDVLYAAYLQQAPSVYNMLYSFALNHLLHSAHTRRKLAPNIEYVYNFVDDTRTHTHTTNIAFDSFLHLSLPHI